MANEMTVYQKMVAGTDALMSVVKSEIGVKACVPFAVRAQEALAGLGFGGKLTEAQAKKAANTFLDNLQTLTQGGITTEDYDKIDFVKRGQTVCVSARSEALIRAAARKGYRIIDTIVPVPKEDKATTYFEENFYQGNIIYTLKDKRVQGDRKITAERIINGYFDRFICRLEITDIKAGKRLLMTVSEISNEEVMAAAAASDNGLFKSKWETYTDDWGNQKKRKVVTNEPNTGSIWRVWTAEMVNKTVIRRALKKVREVLPELGGVILAFDTDVQNTYAEQESDKQMPEIEIKGIEASSTDIFALTESEQADAAEMLEIYKANPKLAKDHADEIRKLFDDGIDIQTICNEHYASIVNIARSKELHHIIQPMLIAAEKSRVVTNEEG